MSSMQPPRPARRGRTSASWPAPVIALVVGALLFAIGSPAYGAQGPVDLGTAGNFAVLAGSGITNTGPTSITGDIGTFPTPSETGLASITLDGTNDAGDAVTQEAKDALVTAYGDAAGRTPQTDVAVELGGSTLLAGVYTSPTFGLTGTLSLDAKGNPDAEFIFQAASTLITASNSRVLLLNGANACHVVWQVGSSATLATGTQFAGAVLALTSITADTGATIQGQLLAQNGAVTLDNNVITDGTCAAPVVTPTTVAASPPPTRSPTTTRRPTTATIPPTTVAASPSPAGSPTIPPTVPGTPLGTPATTVGPHPAPAVVRVAGPPTGPPGPTPPAGPATPGGPGPIVPPSPPPPSVTPPSGTPPVPPLPFTGRNVARLVEGGLALLIVGAGILLIDRRHGSARRGWRPVRPA